MAKGQLAPMVSEAPDPDVTVATCCDRQPGLTVSVNGHWRILVPYIGKRGELGTQAHEIELCRGCWKKLGPDTAARPWTFGADKAIDKHLRQIAREVAG